MDQFKLPYDYGDQLANRQLELPLTDEISQAVSQMNDALAQINSTYTPPHTRIQKSWPPRKPLIPFR